MARASFRVMGAQPLICLYLLGSFRVERDAQTILLPTRKVESLLAYLVFYPEQHAREKLAALFWGDKTDAQARHSLAVALSTLRKRLGTDVLIADRETVQINPGLPLWVDAQRILDLQFKIADLNSQLEIDLYRGDLLADFYDDWILTERERLRAIFLNALLYLVQDARSHSEYARAIEFARKVLAHDCANERAHQHLMFCYLANGDRDAALKQYVECQRALQEEFAVEPAPETTALYNWIKQTRSGIPAFEARVTNLPISLSSFIGRQSQMTQVKQLIAQNRLVTLTGAGGSGKTRLAIQVATDLIDTFKDGVWWVELAALTDESLIPHQVAKALGIQENPSQPLGETLTNWLLSRQLLLVLDNCEHLVNGCAQLAEQLQRTCQDLKLLATSREALGIPGEQVQRVASLTVPDPQKLSLTRLLLSFEGIRLFVERASAIQSDFALTEQNAPAVMRICHRLDGIPLAIELAAARVNVLSVDQIAAHLDDCFELLSLGSRVALPRHQTLRATIDWSYDLLAGREQSLFRRLSVFMGGWTLDAAESACANSNLESPQILKLLSRLVDKSLVIVEEQDGAMRYRMLETIRQYAREKLGESGESENCRNQHLQFFVKFAEEVESKTVGVNAQVWLNRTEMDHDNIRAAMDWALARNHTETGLRLASALAEFWNLRGYLQEGRSWLERALAQSETCASENGLTRARALLGVGLIVWHQGDYSRAEQLGQECLLLFQQAEDARGIAQALELLGRSARAQRDYSRALAFFEKGLELTRKSGDIRLTTQLLVAKGRVTWRRGHYEQARMIFEESLYLSRGAASDPWAMSGALQGLALVMFAQGKYDNALTLAKETWALGLQLGSLQVIADAVSQIAELALVRGDYEQAQKQFEECLGLSDKEGSKRGRGLATLKLGDVAWAQGIVERARSFYEQSAQVFREVGDQLNIARALWRMGKVTTLEHGDESARRLIVESLSILRAIESPVEIANALIGLGDLACHQGNLAEARECLAASLIIRVGLINRQDIADALEHFARLALALAKPERAVRLFAAAEALRELVGVPIMPIERGTHEQALNRAKTQLGDQSFAVAWEEGRAMTLEQAVAYAMKQDST